MNNKYPKTQDVVIIIFDHHDNKEYKNNPPSKDVYKGYYIFNEEEELSEYLEKELNPSDKVSFFIHAMMDKNFNWVEGDHTKQKKEDEPKVVKPAGYFKNNFSEMFINYVTRDNPWQAICEQGQRNIFNYGDLRKHFEQNEITPQVVSDFYTHKDATKKAIKVEQENASSDLGEEPEEEVFRETNIVVYAIKDLIKKSNADIKLLKEYLKTIEKGSKWSLKLFKDFPLPDLFTGQYWNFQSDVYHTHFHLAYSNDTDNNDSIFLHFDKKKLTEDVKFVEVNKLSGLGSEFKGRKDVVKQWEIAPGFFHAISKKFDPAKEDESDVHGLEDFKIATRLYLLHESLHGSHDLHYITVGGIGGYPRIVEEADYQADAFAIITELSYQVHKNNSMTSLEFLHKVLRVIDVALNTTFSFNRQDRPLKRIQVRRVNRYLIWFFHYCRIKNLEKEINNSSLTLGQTIEKVLRFLSIKPLLEISGPAIKSNKAKDRIFYDFEQQNEHKEEIALFINNVIQRNEMKNNMNELFEGLSKSDFSKVEAFMIKVIDKFKDYL
jgi:hypothetical protein